MAFPVVASSALLGAGGNTILVSHDMPMPATVPAGAMLVVIGRTAIAGAVTMPAGWTVVEEPADASNDVTFVAYKTADGTEGGTLVTITHGSGRMVGVSLAITGGGAFEVGPVNTGFGTTPGSLAFTPATPIDDYLWLLVGAWEGEQTQPTHPAGWTRIRYDNSGTAGGIATNCRLDVGYKAVRATNVAAASWTISVGDDWTAFAIAVRYAPPAKATGATAGAPGTFTPPGSLTPANLAAMSSAPAVVASPASAWYSGQYVVLGDASEASWSGSAWVAGRGTATPPAISKLGEIRDDFSRATIAPVWWPTVVGATIDGAGASGRLAMPTTVSPGSKVESPVLDLRGSEMLVRVVPVTNNSAATRFRRTSFKVLRDEQNYLEIYCEGTSSYVQQMYFRIVKNGAIISNGSNEISWDAGYDAYWRIRHDSGEDRLYVESGQEPSPPLTGAWTFTQWVNALVADAFPVAAVFARLESYRTAGDTAGGVAYFDQVNLRPGEVGPSPPEPPSAGIAVKRWTGSAWQTAAVKRWNGSAWVAATPKRYESGAWK